MTAERQDDEILGRALSRAIETIEVNETPFAKSRMATRPTTRAIFGPWQVVGIAAALVVALAIGSWLVRPSALSPVAAPPTASAPQGSALLANATTAPASAYPESERVWVYFARDGLPPVGSFVRGHLLNTSPTARIASRIAALGSVSAAADVPYWAANALSLDASRGISVRAQGDTATVAFTSRTAGG